MQVEESAARGPALRATRDKQYRRNDAVREDEDQDNRAAKVYHASAKRSLRRRREPSADSPPDARPLGFSEAAVEALGRDNPRDH